MHPNRLGLSALALLVCGALSGGAAQAAPVRFNLLASVAAADPGNAFGLSTGNGLWLRGIFDDAPVVPVGDSEVYFGLGSGNHLVLPFGNVVWDASMDERFVTGVAPSLAFLDGMLVGIDYSALLGTNGALASLQISGGGWNAWDASDLLVSGDLDLGSFATSPVPAPATLLLLASALLGLGRAATGRSRP